MEPAKKLKALLLKLEGAGTTSSTSKSVEEEVASTSKSAGEAVRVTSPTPMIGSLEAKNPQQNLSIQTKECGEKTAKQNNDHINLKVEEDSLESLLDLLKISGFEFDLRSKFLNFGKADHEQFYIQSTYISDEASKKRLAIPPPGWSISGANTIADIINTDKQLVFTRNDLPKITSTKVNVASNNCQKKTAQSTLQLLDIQQKMGINAKLIGDSQVVLKRIIFQWDDLNAELDMTLLWQLPKDFPSAIDISRVVLEKGSKDTPAYKFVSMCQSSRLCCANEEIEHAAPKNSEDPENKNENENQELSWSFMLGRTHHDDPQFEFLVEEKIITLEEASFLYQIASYRPSTLLELEQLPEIQILIQKQDYSKAIIKLEHLCKGLSYEKFFNFTIDFDLGEYLFKNKKSLEHALKAFEVVRKHSKYWEAALYRRTELALTLFYTHRNNKSSEEVQRQYLKKACQTLFMLLEHHDSVQNHYILLRRLINQYSGYDINIEELINMIKKPTYTRSEDNTFIFHHSHYDIRKKAITNWILMLAAKLSEFKSTAEKSMALSNQTARPVNCLEAYDIDCNEFNLLSSKFSKDENALPLGWTLSKDYADKIDYFITNEEQSRNYVIIYDRKFSEELKKHSDEAQEKEKACSAADPNSEQMGLSKSIIGIGISTTAWDYGSTLFFIMQGSPLEVEKKCERLMHLWNQEHGISSRMWETGYFKITPLQEYQMLGIDVHKMNHHVRADMLNWFIRESLFSKEEVAFLDSRLSCRTPTAREAERQNKLRTIFSESTKKINFEEAINLCSKGYSQRNDWPWEQRANSAAWRDRSDAYETGEHLMALDEPKFAYRAFKNVESGSFFYARASKRMTDALDHIIKTGMALSNLEVQEYFNGYYERLEYGSDNKKRLGHLINGFLNFLEFISGYNPLGSHRLFDEEARTRMTSLEKFGSDDINEIFLIMANSYYLRRRQVQAQAQPRQQKQLKDIVTRLQVLKEKLDFCPGLMNGLISSSSSSSSSSSFKATTPAFRITPHSSSGLLALASDSIASSQFRTSLMTQQRAPKLRSCSISEGLPQTPSSHQRVMQQTVVVQNTSPEVTTTLQELTSFMQYIKTSGFQPYKVQKEIEELRINQKCLQEDIKLLSHWLTRCSQEIIHVEMQADEINKKLQKDPKTLQDQNLIIINGSKKLRNYHDRLQRELCRFIICFFLAPAGMLKLDANKKEMVLTAIGWTPVFGTILKPITAVLSYANKKYRFLQINRFAELFKSIGEIEQICAQTARKVTLVKKLQIERQEVIKYEGWTRIPGLWEKATTLINQQWNDLTNMSDTTGVTLCPEEKLAVLDVAYILQQILSGDVKIDQEEDLSSQFVEILTGKSRSLSLLGPQSSLAVQSDQTQSSHSSPSQPSQLMLANSRAFKWENEKQKKDMDATKKLEESCSLAATDNNIAGTSAPDRARHQWMSFGNVRSPLSNPIKPPEPGVKTACQQKCIVM